MRKGTRRFAAGLISLLVVGSGTVAFAQTERNISSGSKIRVKNLPEYDSRRFHPGFFLGVNMGRYVPEYSPAYAANPTPRYLTKPRVGFSAGFTEEIRLMPHYLALRLQQSVTFGTHEVNRSGGAGALADTAQQLGSTIISLPVLIKYSSNRRRNVRMYLVAGVRQSFSVGGTSKDRLPGQLEVGTNDLSLEYGVGADLFYPLFKFAPELRFSHGLRNLNTGANTDFNAALGRFRSHTVTLIFHFDG